MRLSKPTCALIAVASLCAACSDDNPAPITLPSTTIGTPSTAAASTTPPTPTDDTTPATTPTNAPPANTTTSTTTTSSTQPPQAVEPELTLEEQINRDLALAEAALLAVGSTPASQDARLALLDYFQGDALRGVQAIADQLVENGWTSQPNPEVPTISRVASEVTPVEDSDVDVIAVICRVDATIVVAASPGDPDDITVVNAEVTRFLTEVELTFDAGRWKRVRNRATIETSPGESECDV